MYQPIPSVSPKTSNLVTLLLVGGLLVVAAIVIAPVFMNPHRGSGLRVRKLSNVKQILLAVEIYADDHDGRFPPDMSTGLAIYASVEPYTKNKDIFDTLNKASPHWLGNANLGGKRPADVSEPFRIIEIFESAPYAREGAKDLYRTVGYVDGHARPLTESAFQDALAHGFKAP